MRGWKHWWGIGVLILGLVLVGVVPAFGAYLDTTEDFEAYVDAHGGLSQAAAEAAGYVFEAPWKLVEEGDFFGETRNVIPFPSYDQAVYFGYIDPNAGTGSYEGAPATDPQFKTQTVSVTPGTCPYFNAEWEYYLQTEYYTQGGYDISTVDVVFYDDLAAGPGAEVSTVRLWDHDCTDPWVDSWQHAGPFSTPVPASTVCARLIFSFDPVDSYNNDFFGWLVDDIHIFCSDEPKKLEWAPETPENLPQGAESEKYEGEGGYDLGQWVTGDGEVRFSLAKECSTPGNTPPDCETCGCTPLVFPPEGRDENPLPERLSLSTDGFLRGTISPGEAGNYTFWVMVEKGSGRDYQCICRKFTLAVRSTGDYCFFDDDFSLWTPCADTLYGPLPLDVNLWKRTDTTYSGSCNEPDLTGYGYVAAFTTDSTGPSAGTICTYDTGKQVKGCFCSPEILDCQTPGEIAVGFKSWRDVEYYTGGAYDKTWVEVRVNGGAWQKVPALSWDSRDPSLKAWTWQEAGTGVMTDGNDTIQVRFCFDSVDGYGNSHHGWFIDEVTVRVIPGTPHCTFSCPLPQGFVNEPYDQPLTYTGGIVDRVVVSGLPDGLEAKQPTPGDWRIAGTPRDDGGTYPQTYPLTIQLQQDDGQGGFTTIATCPCDLTIGAQRCFFFEDFEEDPAWLWGALWGRRQKVDFLGSVPVDIDGIPIGVGNHVAYYGDITHNPADYNTGARTTGVLSLLDLPNGISIPSNVEYIELSFDSFRQVEQFDDGYDKTKVQVRWDTGPTWYTVWYRDSGDPNDTAWTRQYANDTCASKAFEKPANATMMWIRFVFDSVDKWYNNYFGWMVDNIKVCWADTGCPIDPNIETQGLAPRNAEPSVMNVPNPVRDVHTTTFSIRAEGVEAIRIQIYDLNETLVFEQEAPGDQLVWHTDNDYGEYLANGIYFYRAYAKIGGIWVPTKFQKLVILR